MTNRFLISLSFLLAATVFQSASAANAPELIDNPALERAVIDWRRYFHENPELSNREFKTSEKVASELRAMGMDVSTGIARTGVVGILKGGHPGPLVGLRADMDGLPVTEEVDLPFRSKAKGVYRGQEVGVMHACGHDTHMAMLLGAAKALSDQRDELKGSVMFIFQPAEEGAPAGEEGGAELMLKEGLFDKQKPDAIFGIHVFSSFPSNVVGYRSGPAMAASDRFEIIVKGKQTHGSRPWGGVDPIVVAAQIISATQTIASRQVDVTKAPSILSYGIVNGGVRNNIIPDEVELVGTIRNFDMGIREQIHNRLRHMATTIAAASGATAEVTIHLGYPVTVNDPALTEKMLPTVRRVAGAERVIEAPLVTGAEDFSYYALQVPGLFLYLGVTPEGTNALEAPSNHSPLFFADEGSLMTGVSLLTKMTLDYMDAEAP